MRYEAIVAELDRRFAFVNAGAWLLLHDALHCPGPDDVTSLSHDELVTQAAQGLLTLQLTLQAVPPSGAQGSSSSSSSGSSTKTSSRRIQMPHCCLPVDARPLLQSLAMYVPEGVLEQGLQHDASEAFQVGSSSSSSSSTGSTKLTALPYASRQSTHTSSLHACRPRPQHCHATMAAQQLSCCVGGLQRWPAVGLG
jgi:hypothetical protein